MRHLTRMPSARARRRCAVWIVAMWLQVFVVLPGAHLVDHDHTDHTHEDGFVQWLFGVDDHEHAHAHADAAPPEAPAAEADASDASPLDHGADSAAHFDVAIVDPPPALPRLHHQAAVQGPCLAAPRALNLTYAGHGWSPRGPPSSIRTI